MKICKNCGTETEDDKIRCPRCGYLFEEDMDSVLRRMKENLNNYKKEVTAENAAAKLPNAESQEPVSGPKERFELLAEVAQLKGEVKALHGEIDRMHASSVNPQAAPQAMGQGVPQQPVYYAQPYPAPYAQPYNAAAYGANPYGAKGGYAQPKAVEYSKRARSANRIVISIVCTLLIALSIGMFFQVWLGGDYGVKGFDAFSYIFDKDSEGGLRFAVYLEAISAKEFAGNATIANICRNFCKYVVQYGVLVYAGLVVLGFPILFSLGGKLRFRGWHRFFAWVSFLAALLLFGVFCWVSGFSALTTWFLVGAGANFVRCLFLIFYRSGTALKGGLQQ